MTLRTVVCECCGGDGGWEADDPVYGWRRCCACGGRGEIEVEIQANRNDHPLEDETYA